MKALLTILLLGLVAASSLAQDSGHATRLLDVLGESMTKGSLKKLDDLFIETSTLYWVDKKAYGKPAILKFLRAQIPADKFELSFNPDDGLDDENVSTTWGTFGIIYGSGEGSTISNQIIGRYTAVAKKTGDNAWQLVSLHLSIARSSGSDASGVIKS